MTATSREADTRRPHGGRRLLIWLLIVLLLLVLVDRGSAIAAGQLTARRLESGQQLDRRPAVRFGGFPFLTQLAGRNFTDVTVRIDGLVAQGNDGSVRISRLDAELQDVRFGAGFKTVTAGRGTGTARLNYADLSRAVGATVTYGGAAGRLKLTGSVTILGQKISGTVSAGIRADGARAVSLQSFRAESTAGGNSVTVPQALVDAVAARFNRPVILDGLPSGLAIQSVTADPEGLVVAVAGTDVRLD
ncbi:MAG: Secreted protein [Frankiales bacterium]|nr:Secreted protein [Frankiales bacterium]